jgi:hypothetical protein
MPQSVCDCLSGVIVSMHTKDYKIGICCCFSTMHSVLRRKSKDWLARSRG